MWIVQNVTIRMVGKIERFCNDDDLLNWCDCR